MSMSGNSINNNDLSALVQRAGSQITSAIKKAAAKTGVDFAYLMEKASAESSFNAKAQSKSSSASGLYQFIESTWLNMVKDHGEKYGMGDLAAKINDNGKVADPAVKKQILELRKDPEKAALMAAEFAAGNQDYLQRHLDKNYGDIGSTELYMAHFMGAGGATAFLNAMKENPLANAADMFPKAARANHNVFYDSKTEQSRTLAGIYDFFDKKFGNSPAVMSAPAQVATNTIPQIAPTIANAEAQDSPKAKDEALRLLMAQDEQTERSLLDFMKSSYEKKPSTMAASEAFEPTSLENRIQAQHALRLNMAHLLVMAQLDGPSKSSNNR